MIEWAGTLYTLGKELYGYFKDGKELYDAAKGGYDAVKDIKGHFEVNEGDSKLIDFEWVKKSGFQTQLERDGYEIGFVKPDKIASRELDGWEIMFEVDKSKHIKRRLVLYDGLTLIGRKMTPPAG